KATRLPAGRCGRWAVPGRWRRCGRRRSTWLAMLWDGGSTRGCARHRWLELMAQFKSQVPRPLRDHLPALLSRGPVAAPSLRIDVLVFIRERWLKGAAMQGQFDHIARGERLLRETCEEEFVDDARTPDAHWTLLFPSPMSGDDHAAGHAFRPHRH